jgi:hypothetical protein
MTPRLRWSLKISAITLGVFSALALLLHSQERSATSAALRDVLLEKSHHQRKDGRPLSFFLGKAEYTTFWSVDIEESLLQELMAEFDTCNFKLMKASQAPFDTGRVFHGYVGEAIIAGPITSWGVNKIEVEVFTRAPWFSCVSKYVLTRTGFNTWVIQERRIEGIS